MSKKIKRNKHIKLTSEPDTFALGIEGKLQEFPSEWDDGKTSNYTPDINLLIHCVTSALYKDHETLLKRKDIMVFYGGDREKLPVVKNMFTRLASIVLINNLSDDFDLDKWVWYKKIARKNKDVWIVKYSGDEDAIWDNRESKIFRKALAEIRNLGIRVIKRRRAFDEDCCLLFSDEDINLARLCVPGLNGADWHFISTLKLWNQIEGYEKYLDNIVKFVHADDYKE